VALLLEEEPEHAGCRQPIGQRGGLVLRARLPQPVQQQGHAVRVVEGGMGGGPAGQRGGLVLLFRAVESDYGDGVSVAGCVVRGLSGVLVLRGLVDGVTVAV